MAVARGNTVELIEEVRQAVAGDTRTVVGNGNGGTPPPVGQVAGTATDGDISFAGRIFHGIVQQVTHDVAQVRAVGIDRQVGRNDVEGNADRLAGFQFVLFHEGRQ